MLPEQVAQAFVSHSLMQERGDGIRNIDVVGDIDGNLSVALSVNALGASLSALQAAKVGNNLHVISDA